MDCRPSDLQDLAYGFLDDEAARRVRRHAAACERCAADLGRLVAEKGLLARASQGADFAAPRGRVTAYLVPASFAAALLLGLVWVMAPREPATVSYLSPGQDKEKTTDSKAPPPLDEAGLKKEIERLEQALQTTTDKQERNRIQAAINDHKVELARTTEGKPVKKMDLAEKPVKKGPSKYDELTKALEKSPNDPALLVARAEEGLKYKKWDTSVTDAQKVIELEPKNARAHLLLSKALYYVGRRDEGDKAFARACELDPSLKGMEADIRAAKVQKDIDALYGKIKMSKDPDERAALEMKVKELSQELKLLSQGDRTMVNIKEVELRLQQNPDDATALVDRAAWYLDSAKAVPAMKDLERAIALKPDYAPAYLNRAIAHAWLGNTSRAWEDAKRGQQLDPKNMKAIEHTQGTIKKLSGAKKDKQRPAGDLSLEIAGLQERIEELRSMAANQELPAADRDRAGKDAERVAAEIEKLKAELQARPPESDRKVEKKK